MSENNIFLYYLQEIDALHNTGVSYFEQNELSQAEVFISKALNIAYIANDKELETRESKYLALIHRAFLDDQAGFQDNMFENSIYSHIKLESLSDDSDIDTYLANEEKREEIAKLDQLGRDCYDELQYAKAEKFYQRAAELAEELNDLSLMLKERFWLADMQRMQQKYKAALGTFIWLMEVAYSPDLSRDLTEEDIYYVEGGFRNFVDVGQRLPDMAAADLERVIDRGLDWLSSIGKRDWTSGLRLRRGTLWQSQGRKEAALEELEAALALCRRYPEAPGYRLETQILAVADLLGEMAKLEAAENYYREVAESYEFNLHEQQWAWKGLAQVAMQRQDWTNAESYALKSLELARGIESPEPMFESYNVLGDVYWQKKQVELAITAKIQAWRYARQMEREVSFYDLYRDFAEIRLYQATQGNPQHYLPKAQQWLNRALPLALRLDRQVNSTERQTKIQNLQGEYLALLQGEST